MNVEALATELNDLLVSESRSLMHHLDEARPYLTAKTFRIWTEIERLAQMSQAHARQLSALLDRLELPERPLSYAPQVANFHYLTLQSLLPQLIREKDLQIEAYRRSLEHAIEQQTIYVEIEALWQENQLQLEQLQAIEANLSNSKLVAG